MEGRKAKLSRIPKTVEFPVIERSVTDYCKIAAQRLNTFSYEERREFLRLLIDEIVYEGSQVRIRGVIPTSQMNSLGRLGSASYSREKTTSSRVEIAGKAQDYKGFNSYRIANMTVYSEGRNSVDDILFELLKDMPKVLPPLREQLSSELLCDVVKRHPRATLIELCRVVEREHGIELSTTSMSRLLRQQGLTCRARRQLAVSAEPSLLSKAA